MTPAQSIASERAIEKAIAAAKSMQAPKTFIDDLEHARFILAEVRHFCTGFKAIGSNDSATRLVSAVLDMKVEVIGTRVGLNEADAYERLVKQL